MGVPLMDDNTFAWFWIAIIAVGCVVGAVVWVCSL
jgi:hypothetical protein